ncbi:hypothetical protein JRC04_04685 [Mycolicibacterium sp. S2-37]|uniref:hypothetical protein n=1 Tax=Mycolicibacterium sp. S2-37 TaxID=2810297 RepID=UPI001A93B535|nr:hypothetical protein [Mycolicibacterium sp. S2-37]MBO0676755.1 hypothetical protein [Mycolicibacterium sp. S2-37]
MERNVELLERVMQHILDHPEQHFQGSWITSCGTAACFAGWAAMFSGMSAREVYEHDRMKDVGAELLGLTAGEAFVLFTSWNTRDMLQLMVKDLVNGDALRDNLTYLDEVHGTKTSDVEVSVTVSA